MPNADLPPIIVHELTLAVRVQLPNAPRVIPHPAGDMDRTARDLRHAPALVDLDAEAPLALVLQLARQRRGAAQHVLDARQVVAGRLLPLGEHDEDGRGDLQARDAVAADGGEEVLVAELAHDVDGDAELDGHEDRVELPVGVVEGQEADPALLGAGGEGVGPARVADEDRLLDVGDEVVVGDADALGEAGGAGAVVDSRHGGLGFAGGEVGPAVGEDLGGRAEEGGPVGDAVLGGAGGV